MRSDYCDECGGSGYLIDQGKSEQCPQCELLHDQELKADRMMDEIKGN